MKKKLIASLMVAALGASLLAGCGGSANSEDTAETTAAADSSAEAEEDGGEASSVYFDETVEIKLYGISLGATDGLQEVEDAINEISVAAINVSVDITLMDVSTYMEQAGLMLAGGETMDLFQITPLGSIAFNACQSQNQLMDIADLLEEYAPDLLDECGDYLAGMNVDGAQYGVPGYRLLNSDMYVYMRADILDELGIREQAESCNSWSELEAIFEIVYAAQDELPEEMQTNAMISNSSSTGDIITVQPALAGSDSWDDASGYDTLGDSYYIIGVDNDTDTVFSWYESEDFYNEIAIVKSWYEKGYVYLDAATSENTGDTNVANGIAFANVCFSEPGIESSKSSTTGFEVVCIKVSSGPVTTGSARSWGWAVPVTAEEPEAAVAFLNLMYTNADIENLLVYGIEGRDYEVNAEGEAVILDSATYTSNDFLWGNQFLAYPAEGQGGDFRAESLAEMEEAGISKYYGCAVDTDAISNELTAINNVISQYYASLVSGAVTDLDASYETFVNALYSAGLQTVLDAYQDALDAWLAE